ncbi:MAG: methionine aminotransferase [Bacteroidota bacterium]
MQLKSKLPKTGTNIFTIMSALATEYKAVNLGQGFPDFPMNNDLTALVTEAMNTGCNQYVPMAGLMSLREGIAAKAEALYGTIIHSDTEITITPGATYAIYTALTTILHPGDEVIVFEPAYDSYIPNIEVNGAKAVTIPLRETDFSIDWQKVKAAITANTKAILINSPHNPSGTVLSESDMKELMDLVEGTNIYIISDEVYEHLVYDGKKHQSVLRYPALWERSFVCFSFGKTYSCTGWKLGYCIAPATLTAEFRKIHQFNAFTCNSPMQVALANFIRQPDPYLQLGAMMQERRDYFLALMKESRFTFLPSYGSYFVCADYRNISEEQDDQFVQTLTKEAGVALIPISAFYQQKKISHTVRFCFSKKKETLEQAAERLIRL